MLRRSSFGRTLLVLAVLSAALTTSTQAAQRKGQSATTRRSEESARDRPGHYVINRTANLYSAPSADARILRELHSGTVVRVIHVRDQWYDVKSEHGNQDGYIRRSFADPESERRAGPDSGRGERRASSDSGRADSPRGERLRFRIGTFRLVDPVVVRAEPSIDSQKVATLKAGAEVHVVDKQGNWYRIESERGNKPPGYIPTVSAKRIEGAR